MENKYDIFKNKLIIFEGQDHSGKTTVAKYLVDKLNENNIPAIFTFQPGDNDAEYNQMLHDMCKTKKYNLDSLSNLFAFLLDRSEHTAKKIIPALEDGKTVICDRWWYSTIAYQFYGKELLKKFDLSLDFAFWMNKLASHNLHPHYAFYMNRDQEIVDIEENDVNDLFETESMRFKERVKNAYLKLVETGDLTMINVDNEVDKTMNNIFGVINDRFL